MLLQFIILIIQITKASTKRISGSTQKPFQTYWHNLVATADTSNLELMKFTDRRNFDFLTLKLIPSITKHLFDSIKVKEASSITIKSWETGPFLCGGETIATGLLDKEINADLVLQFVPHNRPQEDNPLAWSSACLLHQETNRPILGVISVNVQKINTLKAYFHHQFAYILREVYHILAFDSSLYQYFIDPNTQQQIQMNKILVRGEESKKDLFLVDTIVTPKALGKAQQHFSCPSLLGIPVSWEKGKLNNRQNWEKNALMNDIVGPTPISNPVISSITLAFLEDTGWYQVDYGFSEPLLYGRNKGCGFIGQKPCNSYGDTCSDPEIGGQGCFFDFTAKSKCAKDSLLSNCNLYSQFDPSSDCRISNIRIDSPLIKESFGPGHRCFRTDLKVQGSKKITSACYESRCDNQGKVVIKIGGVEHQCLSTGQKINLSGLGGTVTCPDLASFCYAQSVKCLQECNNNGRCLVGNKCYCYEGFSGEFCEVSKFQDDNFGHSEGQSRWITRTQLKCNPGCANGRCVISISDWSKSFCECPQGYGGVDCASKISLGGFANAITNKQGQKGSSSFRLIFDYRLKFLFLRTFLMGFTFLYLIN